MFRDGLAHKLIVALPAGELLPLMENFSIQFDLFSLVGHIEVVRGCLCHLLLAVEVLDALETTLVSLEVVLDSVQLHYSHVCLIIQ